MQRNQDDLELLSTTVRCIDSASSFEPFVGTRLPLSRNFTHYWTCLCPDYHRNTQAPPPLMILWPLSRKASPWARLVDTLFFCKVNPFCKVENNAEERCTMARHQLEYLEVCVET
mgnify:CR=1 FL=1